MKNYDYVVFTKEELKCIYTMMAKEIFRDDVRTSAVGKLRKLLAMYRDDAPEPLTVMIHDLSDLHNPVVTTVEILVDDPEGFDFETAAKAAARDFVNTDEGRAALGITADHFDYGDFLLYVPETICKKHGFTVIRELGADLILASNESLVSD